MRILALDLGAGWRGGQKQTALVAAALAARGHDVTLVAADGCPSRERGGVDGPRRAHSRSRARRGVAAAPRRGRTSGSSVPPDVLWASEGRGHGAAVWSLAAARTPLVVHRRVAFRPGRDPLSRLKFRAARRFVAISAEVARVLSEAGIPKDGSPSFRMAFRTRRSFTRRRPRAPFPSPSRRGLRRTQGAGRRRRGTRPRRRGGNRRDAHVPRRRTAARRDGTPRRGIRGPFALHFRRRGPGRPERLAASHLLLLPSRSEGASSSSSRRWPPVAPSSPTTFRRRARSAAPAPRDGSFRRSSPAPGRKRSRASLATRRNASASSRRDAGLPRRGRSPRASSGSKTFSGSSRGRVESSSGRPTGSGTSPCRSPRSRRSAPRFRGITSPSSRAPGWQTSTAFVRRSTRFSSRRAPALTPGPRGRRRLAAEIRESRFERAVVFPTSFGTAWTVQQAGIPERIGWAAEGRSPLLTRALPQRLHRGRHQVWKHLLLAEAAGAAMPAAPDASWEVSKETSGMGRALLDAAGLAGRPFAAVHLASFAHAAKRWSFPLRRPPRPPRRLSGPRGRPPRKRRRRGRQRRGVRSDEACDALRSLREEFAPRSPRRSLPRPPLRRERLGDRPSCRRGRNADRHRLRPDRSGSHPAVGRAAGQRKAGPGRARAPEDRLRPLPLRRLPLDHRCMSGLDVESVLYAAESVL